MDLFENKNLDINFEIYNGLNVFDIVCIYNYIDMCKYFMDKKRILKIKIDLDKFDVCGWIIEYFVVMVGNKKIFKMLNFGIFRKINWWKIVLYICCEYGYDDFCEKILENCKNILYDVDVEGWNVLYYVVKGGNLYLYMKLEKVLKRGLCVIMNDGKMVLYIVCINNWVEICRYICSEKLYKGIINS